MSLNDTIFHVIAQTPTRHLPKKYLTVISSLPIVLLLRDTFSNELSLFPKYIP